MQIIPNVYQITIGGFNSVNAFLVTEEKLTLIDTGFGSSAPHIIDFIHKIGRSEKEISLIIITHNHPDHTGSLLKLKKTTHATIAVHKADIGSLPYGGFTSKLLGRLARMGIGKNMYLDTGNIDQPLSGGETLPILGGLQVINTPGHTPGSISLYSAKNKILFAGDLINHRHRQLRIPYHIINFNTDELKESVKLIAILDFETLCVGHGKPLMKDGTAMVRQLVESK